MASKALVAHLVAARAAWPSLAWEEAAYRAWLESTGGSTVDATLAALAPGEVVLSWAIGRGDEEALRLFEEHFMPYVARALKRRGESSAFLEEVEQRVRIKLLCARDGEPPAITRLALGGSLVALVRVAAVREAVSLRRSEKSRETGELDDLVGVEDPVLEALKARHGRDVVHAIDAAIAELSVRDRRILRLSIASRASIDDIARMFDTHRATAARWLIAARNALAEATRRHLRDRLHIDDAELDSILRLVRSEVTRIMGSDPRFLDDP
jgi:RNA polymerase sigma-70 factor (ECF subfamily)